MHFLPSVRFVVIRTVFAWMIHNKNNSSNNSKCIYIHSYKYTTKPTTNATKQYRPTLFLFTMLDLTTKHRCMAG